MKHVTIDVPKGKTNLSSITGSYEILTRANSYWEKLGNKPKMEISIAGFVPELKLDSGFFSIHPISLQEIKVTDLLIIPSVNYDENLIEDNAELIKWIKDNIKPAPK